MPRSMLLSDADEKRLTALCEKAFPNRAPSIMSRIVDEAQWLFYPSRSDNENLAAISTLTGTRGEEFTRATPSPDDYVKHAEQAAKDLGREWSAQDRIAALRRGQAMTADERCAAVPFAQSVTQKNTDTAPKSTAPALADNTAPHSVEHLDKEIERRTGKDPRSMLTSERLRYHAEIQRTSAKSAPATDANERWGRALADRRRGDEARKKIFAE